MISKNKDGEIIAKVYSLLGIESIRGSSSKGAAKALISTIKEIKSGSDVALTPDGPRGLDIVLLMVLLLLLKRVMQRLLF